MRLPTSESSLAKSAEATAADVAGVVGLDQRAAALIMDACVAVGLLQKEGSAYRNTPESGAFLVPGGPGDLSKALWYMRDVYPGVGPPQRSSARAAALPSRRNCIWATTKRAPAPS